ncbi:MULTISPECIES: transposase family protein [unclassified Rhizobium]|uniref:transposase family protein n=1 Tax=unclassified Rhizobium TaxID=2613769 RepID=UPI0012E3B244|nr:MULTISPECIES: transposase family protein [unclassified Rhizobium]
MQQRFPIASLAPSGFAVDEVEVVADSVLVRLRARHLSAVCPDCGRMSRRIQSQYMRRPADLPFDGRRVELAIVARRFWCDAVLCGRRIFCEQFDKDVLARYGRRT